MTSLTGQCLCGEVAFSVMQPQHLDACHCDTCRRWSGGPYIGMDFAPVELSKDSTLKWYKSSDWAERGFCSACGSSLFYRLFENPEKYSICIGALDNPPEDIDLKVEFFIDQKPDYYAFEGDRKRLTGEEVFALYAEGNQND